MLTSSAFHCSPEHGATVYNRVAGTEHVVNCRHRTCTCRMCQKQRTPCKHACCVLSKLGKEPRGFADDRFSQNVLLSMLDRAIGSRPGPDWKIIHDLVAKNCMLGNAVHSAVSATPRFLKRASDI